MGCCSSSSQPEPEVQAYQYDLRGNRRPLNQLTLSWYFPDPLREQFQKFPEERLRHHWIILLGYPEGDAQLGLTGKSKVCEGTNFFQTFQRECAEELGWYPESLTQAGFGDVTICSGKTTTATYRSNLSHYQKWNSRSSVRMSTYEAPDVYERRVAAILHGEFTVVDRILRRTQPTYPSTDQIAFYVAMRAPVALELSRQLADHGERTPLEIKLPLKLPLLRESSAKSDTVSA